MKVTLCGSCVLGANGFAGPLRAALSKAGIGAEVAVTDCLSGCTRPSTVAFRASGKTAYLFGDVTAGDLDSLITFARLYEGSPDGTLTDARPLGALRHKAMARIPG